MRSCVEKCKYNSYQYLMNCIKWCCGSVNFLWIRHLLVNNNRFRILRIRPEKSQVRPDSAWQHWFKEIMTRFVRTSPIHNI